VGDVNPLLVIADATARSDYPAKGALDDPAAEPYREAFLLVAAPDDLDDELKIAGFVHELEATLDAIGEKMLDPGPALANENMLVLFKKSRIRLLTNGLRKEYFVPK